MSQYFNTTTDPKLKCSCCDADEINIGFLLTLDAIREDVDEPLVITSGYRCPDYNERISKTGRDGPHTTGFAADISCSDSIKRMKIVKSAVNNGCRVGIAKSFVHVDVLSAAQGFPENVMWVYQ